MCRWQLKHSGLLSLVKQSQKNDLAVREFQSVVVRPGNPLIDLAKDRRLVPLFRALNKLQHTCFPAQKTHEYGF